MACKPQRGRQVAAGMNTTQKRGCQQGGPQLRAGVPPTQGPQEGAGEQSATSLWPQGQCPPQA